MYHLFVVGLTRNAGNIRTKKKERKGWTSASLAPVTTGLGPDPRCSAELVVWAGPQLGL